MRRYESSDAYFASCGSRGVEKERSRVELRRLVSSSGGPREIGAGLEAGWDSENVEGTGETEPESDAGVAL